MALFARLTRSACGISYISEWKGAMDVTLKRHCSDHTNENPKSVAASDGEGEFRVYQLVPSKEVTQVRKEIRKRLMRELNFGEDTDWTNIWVGPKTFNPYMVPLPIRQGLPKGEKIPDKYGNAELMKIPNFLHLTPPAVKKHCEALKKFCTEWPAELNEENMEDHFPVTVIASDYCHSSPTIRDPMSRILTVKINIEKLGLGPKAKDKFLRLVGERYDNKTGVLTITAENCPLKKQNYDHALYILTALCHESRKIEDWEKEKSDEDMEYYNFETRQAKRNIMDYFSYSNVTVPDMTSIGDVVSRYLTDKETEKVVNECKSEVIKILGLPEFQQGQ